MGWLSIHAVITPPPVKEGFGVVVCAALQGQTAIASVPRLPRPVRLWAQKKVRPCESDLEEAATYSPTGEPQYHRRK